MSIGTQIAMGITMDFDASGVLKGAQVTNTALKKIQTTADGVSSALQKTSTTLNKSLDKASIAFGAMGAGLVGVGRAMWSSMAQPMIAASGQLQTELLNFQNITQSTDEQVKTVSKSVIGLGSSSLNSAVEVTQMMSRIGAWGNSVEESLKRAPVLLRAIAVSRGALDPETGANAFEGMITKFQDQGATYQEVADKMMVAANETALAWEDLPILVRSMRDVPAVLRTTMSDFFAMAGALKNVMTPADAAQNLKAFGRRMILVQAQVNKDMMKNKIGQKDFLALQAEDPELVGMKLKKAVEAYKVFNIPFFDVLTGQKRKVLDIVDDFSKKSNEIIRDKGENYYLTNLNQLFADNARTVMNAFRQYKNGGKEAGEALKYLSSVIDSSTGQMDIANENLMKSSEMRIKRLKATWESFLAVSGEGVTGVFGDLANSIQGSLAGFSELLARSPALNSAFAKTIVYGAALATILGVLALGLASVFFWISYIKPALLLMFSPSLILSISTVAAPLLTIAAVLGVLWLALDSFMDLTGKTSGIEDLSNVFSNLGLVIKGVFEFWDENIGGRKSVYDELKGKGVLKIVEFFLQAKMLVVDMFNGFKNVLRIVLFPLGAAVWLVVKTIMIGVIYFGKLLGLISGSNGPISEMRTAFEAIGNILGIIVTIWIAKYIIGLGLAIVKQGTLLALTVATNLKFYLIIAAIVIIIGLVYKLSDAIENALLESADKLEKSNMGFAQAKYEKLPENMKTPQMKAAYDVYGSALTAGDTTKARADIATEEKTLKLTEKFKQVPGIASEHGLTNKGIEAIARSIATGKDTGGVAKATGGPINIQSLKIDIKATSTDTPEMIAQKLGKALDALRASRSETGYTD